MSMRQITTISSTNKRHGRKRETGKRIVKIIKELRDILTKAMHGPCLDSDSNNPNVRTTFEIIGKIRTQAGY